MRRMAVRRTAQESPNAGGRLRPGLVGVLPYKIRVAVEIGLLFSTGQLAAGHVAKGQARAAQVVSREVC